MDLLHKTLSDDCLLAGWAKVRENAGAPGVDGITIERFARDALFQIGKLRAQVREGRYLPQPLLQVRLEREGRKPRFLAIPAVRDRVLQSAACQVIVPILDKEFENESWAYRRGRSVQMALAQVAQARDQGYQWVVDADIQSFFDEVDHATLFERLARHIDDAGLMDLIRKWIQATLRTLEGNHQKLVKGIPQGAPISPVLANLYLDDFDEAILDENLRLVRFADDFLILCRHRDQAEDALELSQDTMSALKLRLNSEKTRITHFDEGFRFLGVNFLRQQMTPVNPDAASWLRLPDPRHAFRSMPARSTGKLGQALQEAVEREKRHLVPLAPEPSDEGTADTEGIDAISIDCAAEIDPLARTLYLIEQGLVLSREGERLVLSRGDTLIEEIPIRKIDQVIIHGNALVTTAALRLCLENNVSVHLQRVHGQCYGTLTGFGGQGLALRLAQYRRATDAGFRLEVARAMVSGKIANARLLLRRYARRHPLAEEEIRLAEMDGMRHGLASARTLDEVRGHEGMAARIYFGALTHWLEARWGFDGRHRQPPTDPVNAMLSYGYAILFSNVLNLIHLRGLDAHLGFLHGGRDGHAALASDLMEEFRPLVVDAVVLHLMLGHQVGKHEFIIEEGAERPCRLGDPLKKRYIHALETKFNALLTHPRTGMAMDWRRAIRHQVHHLARVITGDEDAYHPLIMR